MLRQASSVAALAARQGVGKRVGTASRSVWTSQQVRLAS
jgi:hypothetical protein